MLLRIQNLSNALCLTESKCTDIHMEHYIIESFLYIIKVLVYIFLCYGFLQKFIFILQIIFPAGGRLGRIEKERLSRNQEIDIRRQKSFKRYNCNIGRLNI